MKKIYTEAAPREHLGTATTLAAVAALILLTVADAPHPAHAAPDSSRVIVQIDAPAPSDAAAAGEPATSSKLPLETIEALLAGTDWRLLRTYDSIPFVALEVSPTALAILESSDAILSIQEDRRRRATKAAPRALAKPLLIDSGPLVQADEAWERGYDGSGWTVAVVDDGVDGNHPFLAGTVVAGACFTSWGNCPNGENVDIGLDAGRPCDYLDEDGEPDCTHGTHVAGIAVGRGGLFNGIERGSGIARGASLIPIQTQSQLPDDECRAFDEEPPCFNHYESDLIAALDHVYSLRDEHRIASVNLSIGGFEPYATREECDREYPAEKAALEKLRSVGIPTAVSSGNEEYTDGLVDWPCLSPAVSVGATTKDDAVAEFSNSASYLDLLAPGDGFSAFGGIVSSIPGSAFEAFPGTSMAAPHVAGAFAILSQVIDGRDVDLLLQTLRDTGKPVRDHRNGLTKPRIRLLAAIEALTSGSPSGIQVTPNQSYVLISKDVANDRWAITLNRDDGTVTGNVFTEDDGPPQFVWCEETGRIHAPDPDDIELRFSCFTAGRCLADTPCEHDEWRRGNEVTLSGSFFRAAGRRTAGDSPAATVPDRAAANESARTAQPSQVSAPAGRVETPDDRRVLVNKNVGDERWAISLNPDGTITGNVYHTGGGDPDFLWCAPVPDEQPPGGGAGDVYSCSAARRCIAEPCPAVGDWQFVASVTLPPSFFTTDP